MLKSYNTKTLAKPGGSYTHVYEVPAGHKLIVLSGQVGMRPNGKLAQGFKAQCEQAYKNVLGHLKSAGASKKDIFKFTVFLTRATDIPVYREVRKQLIGDDVLPTSTLLVISALAHPDMLVEVEAYAALPDKGK
jgi:2-iminobutanoate/2-iminopropanoate deaminase